ncbi:JAB domain-containing protein [Anditalea andensis]|uniref:JAB domain-containing protein n=1 Tax=Anditalea andensis TaxID=1048983 RepID=UPI00068DF3AD|nr:JAB domain-containing protein [Anditalea andensis]
MKFCTIQEEPEWQIITCWQPLDGNICVNKAIEILATVYYKLSELAKWDQEKWLRFKGVGISKATALVTAFELGKRRMFEQPKKRFRITSSADVYGYMKPYLYDESVEHLYIILINRNNQVLKLHKMSTGGTAGTVVEPKLIFQKAIEYLANALILIHNHPSGNLKPSIQDKNITCQLKEAGKHLEIPIMDLIIFTDQGYFIFVDLMG